MIHTEFPKTDELYHNTTLIVPIDEKTLERHWYLLNRYKCIYLSCTHLMKIYYCPECVYICSPQIGRTVRWMKSFFYRFGVDTRKDIIQSRFRKTHTNRFVFIAANLFSSFSKYAI